MKIEFQSVHFNASEDLKGLITKKLEKLEQFYDRIVDADVYMKEDNTDPVRNQRVEIRLNVPGTTLFAESNENSFESAADKATEALRRQIIKHKEKASNRY